MLKLPAVFSNHMVLQREKRIAIFGYSTEKEVIVELKDSKDNVLESIHQKVEADADASTCEQKETATGASMCVKVDRYTNNWYVELSPRKAGGPYSLCISDGNDSIVFTDIMIGEVWLAGGQSNMEFELGNSKGGAALIEQAKQHMEFASYKDEMMDTEVRFYYVPKIAWIGEELLLAEKNASWELMSSDTCSKWSAVGYYFARRIAAELGIVVGIIGCNWGGTSASCWTSRAFLESNEKTKDYVDEYDRETQGRTEEEYLEAYVYYKAKQTVFEKNVGEYYMTHENPTWDEAIALFGENLYPGPMGSRNERRIAGLYECMLQRVMPYSLRGFLFYQAEEDDHRPYTYAELFETMIKQWRQDWKDDKLPFIFVQLPMFSDMGAEDFKNWPFLREAQMKVFETIKNTGIAVALDMGEYGNIHPIDKVPVGERLAKQALFSVYHKIEEKDAFGPIYRDYTVRDNVMTIHFSHAQDGFLIKKTDMKQDVSNASKVKNTDETNLEKTNTDSDDIETVCMEGKTLESICGFEIAGEDNVFYEADAKIVKIQSFDGQADWVIELVSDNVDKPKYARYQWVNYGEVMLFGTNGIPVAPFRTSKEDGAVATGSRQGVIFHN